MVFEPLPTEATLPAPTSYVTDWTMRRESPDDLDALEVETDEALASRKPRRYARPADTAGPAGSLLITPPSSTPALDAALADRDDEDVWALLPPSFCESPLLAEAVAHPAWKYAMRGLDAAAAGWDPAGDTALFAVLAAAHALRARSTRAAHDQALVDHADAVNAHRSYARALAEARGTENEEPAAELLAQHPAPGPRPEFGDSGFTRPGVLILTPTRNRAAEIVENIVSLMPIPRLSNSHGKTRSGEQMASQAERFAAEYAADEHTDAEDARQAAIGTRPADWLDQFSGKTDEDFRLNLAVAMTKPRHGEPAKPTRVQAFVSMQKADIIVASPMALRMLLGDAAQADDPEHRAAHPAFDALSSIGLLLVDRASFLETQNWEHVRSCLAALNRPSNAVVAYDRVSQAYLRGAARSLRQTIVTAHHYTPALLTALATECRNHMGGVRLSAAPAMPGVVVRDLPAVPMRVTLRRAGSTDAGRRAALAASDARLEMVKQFCARALGFAAGVAGLEGVGRPLRTLVYVQSYFDFAEIRSYLLAELGPSAELTRWAAISEYTDGKDIATARRLFAAGELELLFVTERAHVYHRYTIKGAERVLFVGAPSYRHFFLEQCVGAAPPPGRALEVIALITRFEAAPLSAIVGAAAAKAAFEKQTVTFSVN